MKKRHWKNDLLHERPIHKLRDKFRTYCGVDPFRRGIRTEGVNVGGKLATCKNCLEKFR